MARKRVCYYRWIGIYSRIKTKGGDYIELSMPYTYVKLNDGKLMDGEVTVKLFTMEQGVIKTQNKQPKKEFYI